MVEAEAAGISETGPHREHNEDAIAACVPEDPGVVERKGLLYVLADGVGGQAAGEVASATSIETTSHEYYSPSSPSRVEAALRHAVQAAHLRVYDLAQRHAEYHAMQTTLSVLALAGPYAYIAHVGDSRIYHWREGRLRQLTSDHSEAAELVRMRVVDKERLRDHPRRNILTRAVGGQLLLRPDYLRQEILPGDQFLQCTDGLWGDMLDEEMEEILSTKEPEAACRLLIDTAIARDCQDNLSAQVVRVKAVGETIRPEPSRGKWLAGLIQRMKQGQGER